jgi:hypothetical protein
MVEVDLVDADEVDVLGADERLLVERRLVRLTGLAGPRFEG